MIPDMLVLSQPTKELLGKVRIIVPPMLEKFHKGTRPVLPNMHSGSVNTYVQGNWAGSLSSAAVKSASDRPKSYLVRLRKYHID